mgnify:CR=1 FL=1
MTTKSTDLIIINFFATFKGVVPFGIIHHGNFIQLRNISKEENERGWSYSINNNERQTLCSRIKSEKGVKTARWFDHLYFINGFGQQIKVTSHLEKTYNVKFRL